MRSLLWAFLILLPATLHAAAIDDSPARPGEWGFRPEGGTASPTNPPAFVWRPQAGAARYQLQVSADPAFERIEYAADVTYNCHCPPRVLPAGRWHWRFRFADARGNLSAWSATREFSLDANAVPFPMPTRQELIGRIPRQHPRLFVRPEQLPRLRELARTGLKAEHEALVAQCERLLMKPPPTAEPRKYPPGMQTKSEEWRQLWWGNRLYTIEALNGAATLGFAHRLGGRPEYGQLARRILLDAARWDPKGATGYRYNDEAGMPYNYYFSRTYTFINDLLSDEEKALCRQVMTVRGREMYAHLYPRQLWQPYGSHQNRAWHFLGEVGIAFLGEIPEAEEWTWFAMNVFFNVYPVWSDSDGGWHEGVSYWSSYIQRFTWFADIMRAAMDVDAYRKPYFASVGYYPMYLQPPGTRGGGFGDLCPPRTAVQNRPLMTVLAAQARNPHWQWYVQQLGGPQPEGGYIGFVRGALPAVEFKSPEGLPSSRCFLGTGQAMLNTSLLGAADNVAITFKSSPFGTQSHGYDANNAFLLSAYGQRLLISSGTRDIYGSDHHANWMWHTKSVNSITVDGEGQTKHSAAAIGRIIAFQASPEFDYVAGEAAEAYGGKLTRFTRRIVFVKPDLVVIHDLLAAPKPSTFEWRLHAPTEMKIDGNGARIVNSGAACSVAFLAPAGLAITQTDRFDPPPRPRIKLTEYHLTAATKPVASAEFVTVIRPHRADQPAPPAAALGRAAGRLAVSAPMGQGSAEVLLRRGEEPPLRDDGGAPADVIIRLEQGGKVRTFRIAPAADATVRPPSGTTLPR